MDVKSILAEFADEVGFTSPKSLAEEIIRLRTELKEKPRVQYAKPTEADIEINHFLGRLGKMPDC
jgi:hypothetical protein